MKRWILRTAGLYPRRWRERYGDEFGALLEDFHPGWHELGDVVRGALKMQITNGTGYLKMAAALAVAGAIAAGAVSFTLPRRYVSSAVVRPSHDGLRQVGWVTALVLSRTSLASYIQRFGLYETERHRVPMEEVVKRMRRDIQIRPLDVPSSGGAGPAFSVSYAYSDKATAQAVVRRVVRDMTETLANEDEYRAERIRKTWPQSPPFHGGRLAVLDSASLPEKPVSPNRLGFTAMGLASGLLLGLLVEAARRRPRGALWMAGFAAGVCALAVGISFLVPRTYTSTAVMELEAPLLPERPSEAMLPASSTERWQQLEQEALSLTSLSEIIQAPALDLYREERRRAPLRDVAETMRTRDLTVSRLNTAGGAPLAVRLSFSYPYKIKAQAALREVIQVFFSHYVRRERARALELKKTDGVAGDLMVVDPASFPESPVAPDRPTLAAGGLAAGLLLGALALRLRRNRSQNLQTA
jgi:LPS O-antigen subunit length determinant protein (WzzB/FepE family)